MKRHICDDMRQTNNKHINIPPSLHLRVHPWVHIRRLHWPRRSHRSVMFTIARGDQRGQSSLIVYDPTPMRPRRKHPTALVLTQDSPWGFASTFSPDWTFWERAVVMPKLPRFRTGRCGELQPHNIGCHGMSSTQGKSQWIGQHLASS